MSKQSKIQPFSSLSKLVTRLRDDLRNTENGGSDFVLLFAYNGTGKTRLSMEFKDKGKKKQSRSFRVGDEVGQPLRIDEIIGDTLYFNAFTEDLFNWDNDIEGDQKRSLTMNSNSKFFDGFNDLALEPRITNYLERYADFSFDIDYDNWRITFSREDENNIKVSRGEETIFVWCIFLAIIELAIDANEDTDTYSWVKYIYIDDPISSLDDNNAIAVACDLEKLLRTGKGKIKTVISSHHSLFFNVMCNELKKQKHKRYFLHPNGTDGYTLRATDDTPFFHHVATLSELQQAAENDELYTYHFNMLRSILEKTATFFGFKDFSACISGLDDEVLYSRALNLLSHGKYSAYEPVEMGMDNKNLFKDILTAFLTRYEFDLPQILTQNSPQKTQTS